MSISAHNNARLFSRPYSKEKYLGAVVRVAYFKQTHNSMEMTEESSKICKDVLNLDQKNMNLTLMRVNQKAI